MKTKISIFTLLIVSITLSVMVSCQKSTTTPSTNVLSSGTNVGQTSPTTQPSNRRTHSFIDDICGTWAGGSSISCSGSNTNCLCDVIIVNPWWKSIVKAANNGSSGVQSFFSDSTDVANTFPILWDNNHSGNQDSILTSGNYYITIEQKVTTTKTNFFVLVKHNTTNTLAFVMPFDTVQ